MYIKERISYGNNNSKQIMATSKKELKKFHDIPEYEGRYQINKLGEIKSLKHQTWSSRGFFRKFPEKILKHGIDAMGYHHVRLHQDSKYKLYKIHQLIAIVFLGHVPCGHKIVCDHIDNDKDNNKLSNIQLISQRENCSKDKTPVSGYTGVTQNPITNKWWAMIHICGTKYNLGSYNSAQQASRVYQSKVKELKI